MPFELDYGPPAAPMRCPRLCRLLLGLLLACVGTVQGLQAHPAVWAAVAVAVAGGALVLHALLSDLLHVETVSFHSGGLRIRWSHAPHLLGGRIAHTQTLSWDDVPHPQWLEGALEHDLKQHLGLQLALPAHRPPRPLKLLVCDNRHTERCEALLAQLPPGVEAPFWLASARQQRPSPDEPTAARVA